MLCVLDKIIRFILLFFLFSVQVVAEPLSESVAQQTNSYKYYLDLANQQFTQGDYVQSKENFEKTLSHIKGKKSRSIYYNLGSVCYKLNQFDESASYFEKLINDEKLSALAYYNLALIENKQGNKTSAQHYLNKSKNSSTNPQLSALVDKQLLKLKRETPEQGKEKSQQDWHAYLYLSTGYDSNINFTPLEVASDESGSFIQGIGQFDKAIAGDRYSKKNNALLVTGSVFLSNYFSTDFNDYNLYDLGLRYLIPVNKWRNSIDLNVKQSTYGHTDYQRHFAVTFKTKRRFSGGDTLRLRYRYSQIDSLDSIFDYLEGNQQKLRMGYQFKWPDDSVYLWYELETNDRNNTQRRNYSPTRNSIRARYQKKLNRSNKVYAEIELRHSDYQPTATQDRFDKRTGYLLAYVYDIKPDWQLLARWGFRNNRSTDSVFSYDRHVALITLRKSF